MTIIYCDEIGTIARENDIDYIINVSDVVQIKEGNFEN